MALSFQGPVDSSPGLVFPRDPASTCDKKKRARERSQVEQKRYSWAEILSSLFLWIPPPCNPRADTQMSPSRGVLYPIPPLPTQTYPLSHPSPLHSLINPSLSC